MPHLTTPNGIGLEYETFGDRRDPAVLLVTGFGAQLISWADGFCALLAAGGRFVIRYDNRDCGLSQQLTGTPDLPAVVAAVAAGDHDRARELVPYTLRDMADDGLGLLTALGIERAHVVGASMGGVIAQLMAIEHPERVLSLTSMASSTAEPEYGQSTPEALAVLMTAAPDERDAVVDAAERTLVWASRRYGDVEAVRDLAARSYDRCHCPDGAARQLAALLATRPTAEGLRGLHLPALVLHGRDDTLVTLSGGERTAALIPGARLVVLDDMGHDRPPPLWPLIVDEILRVTAAGESARGSDVPDSAPMELRPFGTLTIVTDPDGLFFLGATSAGKRIIQELKSVQLDGRVQGTMTGKAAADWLTVDDAGNVTLDIRVLLTTDDGAQVYVHLDGRAQWPERLGDGPIYSRATLEAGDERYAWVNHLPLVSKGAVAPGGGVAHELFELV